MRKTVILATFAWFAGWILGLVTTSRAVEPVLELPVPHSAAAQTSEPREKIPPAQTHYMGRQIATTMHFTGAEWLVRESRQREEDGNQMLRALEVKPGQTICDLGCGNGFYSLRLARMTGPEGKVYAVDIQPEMIAMLKARAKKTKASNIVPIVSTAVDPRLPEGQFDLVLLVDVYHEFSHPETMLAAIRNSLKPAGRVALVEFRTEDPAVPIQPLHKMSKKQILKEFPANGFKLVAEYDKLPWQHLMFFARDDRPAANGHVVPEVSQRNGF